MFFETGGICVVSDHDIKVYWCSYSKKKKASKSLSSTALFYQTGRAAVLRTDEDNINPFPKSLGAKCAAKFILFQMSRRRLLQDDVMVAAGTRAVPPSRPIPPQAHTPVTLHTQCNGLPLAPRSVQVRFCQQEIRLKHQVFRAFSILRLQMRDKILYSSTS